MQLKSTKRVFHVVLFYPSNMTRTVKIKASSREVAERRALKLNPGALGVDRGK